nr:RNA-directed DNA polymerase, eukaryota [Tanacetum cinerariifolium]
MVEKYAPSPILTTKCPLQGAHLRIHTPDSWRIHHSDVKNAFLYSHLSEAVYMHHPPSRNDSPLYIFHCGYEITYLLIYVDDIIFIASSSFFLQWVITSLHGEFAMTNLSSLNDFIGFSSQQSYACLVLSQSTNVEEILERAHIRKCNPCGTLVDTGSKLGPDGDHAYLMLCTWYYHGLQLHVLSTSQLTAYADAEWAGCPVTKRSTSGYCVFLGDNLLSWCAKWHVTLSRSSAEAEYRGVATVVVETAWVHNLLRELNAPLFTATLVYFDNIRRMHLYANVVRYDRPPLNSPRPNVAPRPSAKSVPRPAANGASSYVSVLKGNPNTINHTSLAPAQVLDEECLVERDLENFVLGEVKDFSSINNLHSLLSKEGFQHMRLVYVGGFWVMIELPSSETKSRFLKHVGVAFWFRQLQVAQPDFVSRERIIWIDIEGVPFLAWSRPNFSKIGSRWGEMLELEENEDDNFARKRVKDVEFFSNDDSVYGEEENNIDLSKKENLADEDESDIEGISEIVFGEQEDPLDQEPIKNLSPNVKENSSDPFNLINLINKRDKGEANLKLESSLRFPSGFTPADEGTPGRKHSPSPAHSEGLNSRVLEETQATKDQAPPKVSPNLREGGSILEVIDDMIKVGQAMGFTMDGSVKDAKKDWIKELNNKHKVNFLSIQETKINHISDMDIKSLWGNSKFDYFISESVGNSGGILCIWDPNVFCKEQHIISDNFVAIYGSWVSKKVKILMIAIYAPQSSTSKRLLWNFISSLIGRWDGQFMVMWDFNEVRCMEDRFGSEFNVQSANEFNGFISNSGLVEIQLEGYSFTWSLQSAKRMSKLDRFFVSDGLFSIFSHLSGIFLDRHLSDHRLILLREVAFDYRPSPFRVYHSLFNLQGFNKMVSNTWNNLVSDDKNMMVRFEKKLQILKKNIRIWVNDYRKMQSGHLEDLCFKLRDIDTVLDQGGANDDIPQRQVEIVKKLHDINSANARDNMQKAKIKWAIEGDENSKFFHRIINRKRANLAIKGVMADGEWVDDPYRVKEEFRLHFANRFRAPGVTRALLFKWGWRFISRDKSLWRRLILSIHGSEMSTKSPLRYSTWLSIVREIQSLKDRGVDLVSHCRINVGNGLHTSFWKDVWIGDTPLYVLFPRIFALDSNKDCSVAMKLLSSTTSLCRPVRGGSESSQLSLLNEFIQGTSLSSIKDRYTY